MQNILLKNPSSIFNNLLLLPLDNATMLDLHITDVDGSEKTLNVDWLVDLQLALKDAMES